jgi:hypothetical protein
MKATCLTRKGIKSGGDDMSTWQSIIKQKNQEKRINFLETLIYQ